MSAAGGLPLSAAARLHVADLADTDRTAVSEACQFFAAHARMMPQHIATLLAVDPVPAIVGVLKRHAADGDRDDVLLAACHAAAAFLDGQTPGVPPQVDAFAAAGGIPVLVTIFKGQLDNVLLVESLLPALTGIAQHGPRHLAALVDAGCIPLAVAALRAHTASDSAAYARYVAQLLQPLASGEHVARVVEAGGLDALVGALKAFHSSAFTLRPVCVALYRLVGPQTTPAARARTNAVVAAGVVPVLVSALGDHVREGAAIAEYGMLLSRVARFSDAAARQVPADRILAAFMAYANVDVVATPLLMTMLPCSCNPETGTAWCAAFVAAHGIRTLVAAMRFHVSRGTVVAPAAQILMHVCVDNRAAVIAAGGAAACLEALRANLSNEDAVNCLCGLLHRLCQDDASRRSLVKGGVLPLLLAGARNYAIHDGGSANATLLALSGIAQDADARSALVDTDAVKLAVSVLKTHAGFDTAVYAACWFLHHMSTREPRVWAQISTAGGVPLVTAALTRYPTDALVVSGAVRVLAHMSEESTHWKLLSSSGALPLVQAALRSHARSGDIAADCCRLMRRLAALPTLRPSIVTLSTAQAIVAALQQHASASDPNVSDAACELLGGMVCERYDNGTCWSGSEPPLSHFYDLASFSPIVDAALAAGVVPLAIGYLLRMHRSRVRGDCDCAAFALAHMLTASKVGLKALVAACDATAACRLLVGLVLQSPPVVCTGTSRYALAAVVRMAAHGRLRRVMVDAGVLDRVCDVLDTWLGSICVTDRLCLILFVRLAADPATCESVVARGGVASLCRFLKHVSTPLSKKLAAAAGLSAGARVPSPSEESTVVDALRGLANVAQVAAGRDAMAAAGAVQAVVDFVHVECAAPVVAAACACLRAYAMGDGCEVTVNVAGGQRALVRAVSTFGNKPAVLEHACGALWNLLGSGDASCRQAAVDAGAPDALRRVVAANAAATVVGRFARGALDGCVAGE